MHHLPIRLGAAAIVVVAGLTSCGDDDPSGSATTTTTADTTTTTVAVPTSTAPRRTTTSTPRPTTTSPQSAPTTADGGGGMQAGAPEFETFTVTSPVPCQSGNATTTMSFTTLNVVQIEIKIGDGSFEGTAGYGPNETDVVASIPCSGPGQSTVQLRGCTEDDECATSDARTVTITD